MEKSQFSDTSDKPAYETGARPSALEKKNTLQSDKWEGQITTSHCKSIFYVFVNY